MLTDTKLRKMQTEGAKNGDLFQAHVSQWSVPSLKPGDAVVMDKLAEHYGVLLSESVIRRVTLFHGCALFERDERQEAWPALPGAERIIAGMDGSMVPIMEPEVFLTDRRKGKRLRWKEAKIALANPQGSQTLSYGGTLEGDAEKAGQIRFDTACWIAEQVEERFGQNGRYLLDFYHVCEYLNAAAQVIVPTDEAHGWMETQKEHLKCGQAQYVLEALEPYREDRQVKDEEAPVRACHRDLVQQRLKRPGAWWRSHNAEYMLALRLNRANHRWQHY
ncbi:hypothetical protein FACS189441_7640 [Betaproteobacteria bacterium]|nr:hypothetical protein FACS189441_7640 [Betaproteobacteria bacterium]